jgi:hypothetical protein
MLQLDKGLVGFGSKWTLRQLKLHLSSEGVNFKDLFNEIEQIITMTLLTLCEECPMHNPRLAEESPPFFELFGFDVMVD